MKKKLVCGLLSLGLLLGSAQGAGAGFSDVTEGDWFAPYVSVCVENGLMNGTGDGKFSPEGSITVAEVAAIAARLGERLNNVPIVYGTPAPGETLPWYHWYVEYLKDYGLTLTRPEAQATRQEFFTLLSAVTPSAALTPINSITALPDTQDENVLAFYNAGILTGTDAYGAFSPARGLTRSEAAAMIARIVDPALRQSFVPASSPPSGENQSGDLVMTVNGHGISLPELKDWINAVAYRTDSILYSYYDSRLDLSDREMAQAILEQAQQQAVIYTIFEEKAAALGCDIESLAQTLTPSPSDQDLARYVKENDLLCAKHILVADELTAQAVLDGLKSVPTLDQFNALLYVFGSDPGMTNNPDGYLFGAGEMVEEFERGTRSLEIGTYTAEPVQSTYGYHIIWRLDPLTHPDLLAEYQQAMLNQALTGWMGETQIQIDQQAMAQIDVAAVYQAYLAD